LSLALVSDLQGNRFGDISLSLKYIVSSATPKGGIKNLKIEMFLEKTRFKSF